MEHYPIHAAEILVENIYCSVATCSKNGDPWSSPLFYSLDSCCNLFWASAVSAVHSRFLSRNPRAFIAIYDSSAPPRTATGLYLRGKVEVILNSSVDTVVARHFDRVREDNSLTGESYMNDSPERMYCFSPSELWTLGEPEERNGHFVDQRVSVTLEDMRQALEMIVKTRLNNCFQPTSFAR